MKSRIEWMKPKGIKTLLAVGTILLGPISPALAQTITGQTDLSKAEDLKKYSEEQQSTTLTTEISEAEIYRRPTPYDGYVMTHEHPVQAMSFGGNYAFVGGADNFENGVMTGRPAFSCGGCEEEDDDCNHGEIKGELSQMGGLTPVFFKEAEMMLPLNIVGADMGAHDSFRDPVQKSFSHVRYSTDWIRDAFDPPQTRLKDARMRVMVAYAMDSEAMCKQLYGPNLGNGGGTGPAIPCSNGDSYNALRIQIENIKAWAQANSSWVGIAKTAERARELARENRLVIVLGVEADYAFGAESQTFDPVNRLEQYYEMGVRTVYLAHKLNSRLSGADVYKSSKSEAGKMIRTVQAISGCFYYDDNVGTFPLLKVDGTNLCNNDFFCTENHIRDPHQISLDELFPDIYTRRPSFEIFYNPVAIVEESVAAFEQSLKLLRDGLKKPVEALFAQCHGGFDELPELSLASKALLHGANSHNGFEIYPRPPGFESVPRGGVDKRAPFYAVDNGYGDGYIIERNRLGLSVHGERVVRRSMELGMLVTLDHVSSVARRQIHDISKTFKYYPLNAFHNNPNEFMQAHSKNTFEPSEYDFDRRERQWIADSGGIFGVRLGPIDAVEANEEEETYLEAVDGRVPNCPGSSTENAKIIGRLMDEGLNIGYALDFATVTEGTLSRTAARCNDLDTRDHLHSYVERGQNPQSQRYKTRGLTHIGVMKKWHRELEAIGLKDSYLNRLKKDGAPKFFEMWERSERHANFRCNENGDNCRIQRVLDQGGVTQSEPTISGGLTPLMCQSDDDCDDGKVCMTMQNGGRQCLSPPELDITVDPTKPLRRLNRINRD